DLSDPISSGSCWSCFSLSGLSAFLRCRLYQIFSGLIPCQTGLPSGLFGPSDVPNISGSLREVPNRIDQVPRNRNTN
ncbi:hypothetical protein, partial [Streptomyces sp. NPDC049813]|uniref:hypothetical protein n=1 Tax=Streptomyces sp. NPDC049813 TaxID=3365597 RepID=UPI0037A00300